MDDDLAFLKDDDDLAQLEDSEKQTQKTLSYVIEVLTKEGPEI